ncbi:MAG: hypothetical protein J6V24_12595, partial [Clostridia bacterium]|nr:hypothetical protein [Clostridia bacterium]
GVLGTAFELVQFEDRYRNVISDLLGRTVVAEDLDTAIRVSRKYGGRFRIVSLTPDAFLYLRTPEDGRGDPVLVAASRQGTLTVRCPMPAQNLLTGRTGHRFAIGENGVLYLRLPSELDPDEIRFDSTPG